MAKPNYRQIFARQKQCEEILKRACPNLRHESGLYFLTREENEIKYAYLGKGVDVCRRMCSHLLGYQQRIDISLRKRGLYSKSNQLGWKLNVLYFPKELLDEKERYYIEQYIKNSYVMYNIENGGTLNKEIIGERKEPKNYTDGLKQGRKNAVKEVKVFFDKYLDFIIKDKPNKVKERKYNEFKEWLNGKEEN